MKFKGSRRRPSRAALMAGECKRPQRSKIQIGPRPVVASDPAVSDLLCVLVPSWRLKVEPERTQINAEQRSELRQWSKDVGSEPTSTVLRSQDPSTLSRSLISSTSCQLIRPLPRGDTVRPIALDTPPDIEQIVIEGYRRMTHSQKLGRVVALGIAAETMASARIRARYGPEISPHELRLRLASLQLDRQTMIEVFAWDPEKEGY